LVVNLVASEAVPRLPELSFSDIAGEEIHMMMLNAFENSTPIKIELGVRDLTRIGSVGKTDG